MLLQWFVIGRSLAVRKLVDGPRPKGGWWHSLVGVTLDEVSPVDGVGRRPDATLLESPKPVVGIRLALVGVLLDGMEGIGVLRCFGVLRLVQRAALLEVERMKLGVLGDLLALCPCPRLPIVLLRGRGG